MILKDFLHKITTAPETVQFADTMSCIEQNYYYRASAFTNGELNNSAQENQGSCKLFSFAKLNGLTESQTLHCFGEYYRDDVLNHPDDSSHGNIRNFMSRGWSGLSFESPALISHQTANTALEANLDAEVFNKLLDHLDKHKEAQNIDLMILANFCRNCLAKWYQSSAEKRGLNIDYEAARERIYKMPYSQWKDKHQTAATPQQLAALESRNADK